MSNQRILVVDDHIDSVKMIGHVLERSAGGEWTAPVASAP